MGYQEESRGAKGIADFPGLSAVPQARRVGSSPRVREALARLARNPRDAGALVAIYDAYGNQLRASVAHWFGDDPKVCRRAIYSVLAAIAQKAPAYETQSMDASEWIRQCAEAEARRLREALDGASTKTLRARRAT